MSLWQRLGQLAYWLGWPALWLYLHGSERTRLLLVADDEILVVKLWLGNGKWALPGGGLHKGEQPQQGLLRELAEETGVRLEARELQTLGSELYARHGHHFRLHYFWASIPKPLPVCPRFWEIVETKWVGLEELTTKNADDNVLRALELWKH